jgi:hypothetical protein
MTICEGMEDGDITSPAEHGTNHKGLSICKIATNALHNAIHASQTSHHKPKPSVRGALFSSKPYQQINSFSVPSLPTPAHTPKPKSHPNSLPPTQPCPRIPGRRITTTLLLLLLAPPRITSIPSRTARIIPTLHHRAVVLTRRWAWGWRRRMPTWRKVLLRVLLLLAIAVLCSRRLLGTVASSLLTRWRREELLGGGRGDGAV